MINVLLLAVFILFLAMLIDIVSGEPPDSIHPVVFTGITISKFKPLFMKCKNRITGGCYFLFWIIAINTIPLLAVLYILYIFKNTILLILFIIIYAYFLKSTFSIKSMGKHINRIIGSMKKDDMIAARRYTSMVVRRNTTGMDSQHIASAAIETIAEGFVDGYLTPLFFYAFFGIAGAMVAKVINTMDSNIAYKDSNYYEFGRCTAIADSITNFLSSRMAPAIFSISAFFLRIKYIKKKIPNSTDSLNAGYSIGAISKILGIRLEKPGEYIVNPEGKEPGIKEIKRALHIYYLSSIISIFIFVIPVMLILYVLGIFIIL
ncbi:cobalamin biosynthesis protein [Ferroplasma sp.]|uniref:cobalamin biosynthesis protein n=1 Tax=Ferroplasma sp. TaxID=2591003 RepID=UPI00307F2484